MNKTREFIKQWKESRGEPGGHLLNFLVNLSRAARLMHECLRMFRADRSLIEEAQRDYIVSIASCLETYYRDLFMDVLARDERLLRSILREIKEKPHLAVIHDLFQDGISFSELATSHFSFQSLEEINLSMSKLLEQDYLNALDCYEHFCVIPSIREDVAKMKLPEEWRTYFSNIFRKRHALVHDSNARCEVEPGHMARFETFALTVTQITSCLVASRYAARVGEDGFKILGSGDGVPVFLVINDLISDDWEVVEP